MKKPDDLKSLGCIAHTAVCDCGGFSKDHTVEFQYWPNSEYGDSFSISTGLAHYLPWYKRLVVGLKYILGIDNTHCFYVETTLGQYEVDRLQKYINKVADNYQETPTVWLKRNDSQEWCTAPEED